MNNAQQTGYEKQSGFQNNSRANSNDAKKSDHSFTQQVADATSNMGQTIRDNFKEGADKVEQLASSVSKQTKDVTHQLESGVKSNPFLAMGVAFAAGIFLGNFTGSKLSK